MSEEFAKSIKRDLKLSNIIKINLRSGILNSQRVIINRVQIPESLGKNYFKDIEKYGGITYQEKV